MDSFYSSEELKKIGLKKIGNNVKVSRKCSIYGNDICIGDNVRIDDFCILSGKISIKNYVHIAAYSALYGGNKGIFVDDYANLSSRVTVYSISDDYSGNTMTNPMILEEYKNVTREAVYIEKHVIVGSTSVILPGVILKEGGAFGAFSFINYTTEPWAIYAGIPIRKIKERSRKLLKYQIAIESKLKE